MGTVFGFWGTRTGVLVILGFILVGVGSVTSGWLGLLTIVGLVMIFVGFQRRSAQMILATRAHQFSQEELLRRVRRAERWRSTAAREDGGSAQCVQIFNHHKAASALMTRLLRDISLRNGLVYGSDEGRASAVLALTESCDVVHFRNVGEKIQKSEFARGLHIVRNPLAVVVSAYFSHLKTHSLEVADGPWSLLVEQRKLLQELPEDEGITATIEFLLREEFIYGTPGPLLGMESWNYEDERFTNIRMEDFVSAPIQVLSTLFEFRGLELPNPDSYKFSSLARGREAGKVDSSSHYRSGDPDDWRNHLKPAHIARIIQACPSVFALFYPHLINAQGSS